VIRIISIIYSPEQNTVRMLSNKLKLLIRLILCLMIFMPMLPAQAYDLKLSSAERVWLQQHPVIHIGVDPGWAPFEYIDEHKQYKGMMADYLKLLEIRLDIRFKHVADLSWADVIEQAKNRQLDMLPGVMVSDQRSEFLHFTQPYVNFPMVIMARAGSEPVNNLNDLQGRHVAVVRSYVTHDILSKQFPEINLELTDTLDEALQLLSTGSIDAYVGNLASISYALNRLGISNLKVAAHTSYSFPLSIGVRKDWPEFVGILQKAIDSLSQEEKDAIQQKWISVEHDRGYDLKTILLLVLPLLAVISTIIILSYFQTRRLKAIVAEKQQSEEKFRSLFETANDGIFIVQDNLIIDCNPKALDLFACDKEMLVGKTPIDVSPQKQPGGERSSVLAQEKIKLAMSGSPQRFDWQHKDLKSELFDAEVSLSVIDIAGVRCLQGIIRDISEQRQIEKALQSIVEGTSAYTGADFFKQLVKQLADTLQMRYAFVGELAGNDHKVVKTISAYADKKHINNFDYPLVDTPCENVFRNEVEICRNNIQSKYPLDTLLVEMDAKSYAGILLVDGQRNHIGILVVLDDKAIKNDLVIHSIMSDFAIRAGAELERIHTEQKLQHAQKMEALGQLTGGIAHDFNNMLASILGYADLASNLKIENKPAKLSSYLDHIHNAADRARLLVSQMLTFSRGNPGASKQPYQLQLIVTESVKMLRPMLPSSITLNININHNNEFVNADPVQLHQLVMNLCINARDAMNEKGEITITLDNTTSSNHRCSSCHQFILGDYVKLIIHDSGPGISEAVFDRMFEPFFTTKAVGKGTGMGLSMVHGIAHSHSGHIVVNSDEISGTSFSVLLPILKLDLEHPLQGAGIELTHRGRQEHILIVDDEASIAEYIKEIVESHGYRASVYTDSSAAMKAFKQQSDQYDLVITDQTMPQLTGEEMAASMLKISPDIPIILCTGYSTHVDNEYAKKIGIKSFMMKPVKNLELLQQIEIVLQK